MDFAVYSNSETINKQLEWLFASMCRPIRFTSCCLLLHSSQQTTKNRRRNFKQKLQIAWTCILCAFICIALVISVCIMPSAYYCIYLIGCIDFFFLIYWNCSMRRLEYSKRLKKSSIGIGTLKNRKQVMLRRNITVAIGSAWAAVVFAILVLDFIGVVQLLPRKSLTTFWCCFYLISLFLVLFCIPSVNCTAFCYMESVASEFKNINRDFKNDNNKHQLPVVRHYIRGHGQLLKLLEVISGAVSTWCSAHFTMNFIAVYKIACYLYNFDYDITRVNQLWNPVMLCFLAVFMLLQSTFILHTALKLRYLILGMGSPMMSVAACDRLPHEQVFPLFSLHLLYLLQKPYGISFFGCTIIDRHFLVASLLLSGLAAIYCYTKYN
uniref:Gustatory receptor n=1 Tax=Haemonchus contortus TaxID=6289 RepID=A0A7I4YBF5_HAECO